ncbi:MAG: nucleotide transporter 5 [uncultured bacterium]|nr:MAG: nucleotide transporter 5 [uncultured bacterium]OGN56867.1 MAG: hypothetical protein A2796_06760 [Chlamydiae bacterium RIFCSPHIGHO2_01_FULL_44_39]OGN59525.1 MAG: hypothetical protein A3D96_07450 [Chlamydiae bacterium RIFCSPHIGHO2_12_FULL_44_59]OGN67270.1 MAG: hypothetical protein A2978_03280 [Chlamydiae bacterium RIFCSPLOWO2_01_FULL_44_52]OGN68692.1 MAG: hypothetical protein A3I67_03010 [Chlamydiae bacterium RIFCSPLOWO2_02_FULL_45_22]
MMLTRIEKFFTFFALLSASLICGEYAMTRPASNALFLTAFSAKAYPYIWLATVPVNLFVVYLYNRFLPKIGPFRMLMALALLSMTINTVTGFFYPVLPEISFLQYIWKDIYILLMLKQLWSMIHSTIPSARAASLYGCIYGAGTVGAIAGSLIPSFLASALGSEKILCLTTPAYLLLILTYTMAYRRSAIQGDTFEKDLSEDPSPKEAVSLIRKTPILMAVLLLVIFMQASVALMEYRFNAHLELNIIEKDVRTAYYGQIAGIINGFSLLFQFIGALLVVKTLGLKRSHFLVPLLLGLSVLSSLAFPTFAMMTCSYIFLKAIDFSLFGVIREMLYVPLQLDAKYRAKAIIDVFAYRTSKAVVSLGLLLMQVLAGGYLLKITGYISCIVLMAWLATVMIFFREKEAFTAKWTV